MINYPAASIEDKNTSFFKIVDKFLLDIEQYPYRYNLFSLLQQLEAIKNYARLNNHPFALKVRLGQEATLKFATSSIQSVTPEYGVLNIYVNGYGLLGVNSPLPLHFTEYIFERKHQYGDKTWLAFINMLQHHLIEQFYQSWHKAQSIASLNNPNSESFSRYIASFAGLSLVDLKTPYDNIHYYTKLYYSGLYAGEQRSASNLKIILSQYFNVPIKIQQNIGYWHIVEIKDRTRIGRQLKFTLGEGLICGDSLYDLQNKFRVIIGPIDLDTYEQFFKNKINYQKLKEWIALYIGYEFLWDYQLILKQAQIPKMSLGTSVQLGLTTWLGDVKRDADDLIIHNH